MVYVDIRLPLRKPLYPIPTNKDEPNNPKASFIALDWTLMTIALIPILIRISMRTRHPRGLSTLATNTADAFVVLAWLSGCVLISINTWKNNLRMKYLDADPSTLYYGVPLEKSGHLLKVSWISLFFIYISLWSSKAAFLAFYYSIFSLQGKKARYGLAGACVFTAATFLLHMGLIAFWCTPISANWSPPPGEHLCSAVHSMSSVTISTFTNIATDIVILAIPISTIMATKLGKTERAGLAFVFLMGSVSILAALVRFICLKLVQSIPRASISHTIDVWALVEIVASILAVCLPSLRSFARHHGFGREAGAMKLASRSSREGSATGLSASAARSESESEKVGELWHDRDLEEEEVGVGRPREGSPF
jgi:glucan phosphoethanolaminetransferase (alkaline phosphatase superfamily)